MPRKAKDIPTEHHLDFETIREELDNLLESVRNKLEREWPARAGSADSAYIIWGQVRVAFVTFRALRYLCAEKPVDFHRKPEFVLAAPPLVRALADALANVVFLFSNLDARTKQYLQGGWREDYGHFLRDKRRLANDASEEKYLKHLEERVRFTKREVGIPDGMSPESVNFWPIPSQMKRDKTVSSQRAEFLQFIEDFFYKELSSASHLSGPSIYERTSLLLKDSHKFTEEDMEEIRAHRSQTLIRGMALALCIAAEVEIEVRIGLAERLIRLWSRIAAYLPEIKQIYDQWYRARLPVV